MKRLVEFGLESNGTILVEVDEPESEEGIQRAAREGDVTQRASQTLEAALDRVRPAAEVIIKRFASLSERPDEIEVEFGLKLSAEAGAFIASGKVEANYAVKLKWVREKPKQ